MSGEGKLMMDKIQDTAQAVAPAVPPVTVSTITLCGYSLETWVLGVTFVYTCVLLVNAVINLWNKINGKESK